MNRRQRRKGFFLLGGEKQTPETKYNNMKARQMPVQEKEISVREKRDDDGRLYRIRYKLSRNGKVFTETKWV